MVYSFYSANTLKYSVYYSKNFGFNGDNSGNGPIWVLIP